MQTLDDVGHGYATGRDGAISTSASSAVSHAQGGSFDAHDAGEIGRAQAPAQVAAQVAAQAPPPLPVPPAVAVDVVREAGAVAAKVCILLADDDGIFQHILAYERRQAGWTVETVPDGVEATRRMRDVVYDAVLLDLNLPHRNGYELLEAAQDKGKVDGKRGPKMVVLSEQSQDEKILRAYALGADDFIQKPLNPRVTLTRLKRLLQVA